MLDSTRTFMCSPNKQDKDLSALERDLNLLPKRNTQERLRFGSSSSTRPASAGGKQAPGVLPGIFWHLFILYEEPSAANVPNLT